MNPYELLGIDESADAAQINAAYKQRLAYYSAAEGDYSKEIEQLNEAYDSLMYSGANLGAAAAPDNRYGDVRAKIREKRYEDAETILDGVPMASREGEWYYLKGTIYQNRGWLEDAADYFSKAVQLDPANSEYAAALESIKNKRTGTFRDDWRQGNESESGCAGSACKLCTALACCDCLCSFCR